VTEVPKPKRLTVGDLVALGVLAFAIGLICILTLTPVYGFLLTTLINGMPNDAVETSSAAPSNKPAAPPRIATSTSVLTPVPATTKPPAKPTEVSSWIVFRIENRLPDKMYFQFRAFDDRWTKYELDAGKSETYALRGPMTPHIRFDSSYHAGLQAQEYDLPGKYSFGTAANTTEYVVYRFTKDEKGSIHLYK
jgi:hypothetical protein